MSEYVRKQALLEDLKDIESIYYGWASEFDKGVLFVAKKLCEKIQSGAFDADNTEVHRLRAALGHIHAIAQSELDDLQYEGQRKTWEEILLTAEEALKGDGNDA